MTQPPGELVELRRQVKASYDMRTITIETARSKRKANVWRPDPLLVEALVAAEEAWSRELLRRRNGEPQ